MKPPDSRHDPSTSDDAPPPQPESGAPLVPKDAENVHFRRWAEGVLRLRWLLLALTLGVTGVFGWQIVTQLKLDNSVEAFASSNSNARELLEQFRDEFGKDSFFLVMAKGDVFTPAYLKRLRALQDEIAAVDMDLPTLGQRKAWRKPKGGAQRPGKAAPPTPVAPAVAAPAAATLAGAGGADADFGDFDDFDDFDAASPGDDSRSGEPATDQGHGRPAEASGRPEVGSATARGEADAGDSAWGDEAGGTIVDEVISLLNVRKTVGKGGTLRVGKLLDPMPDAAGLAALKPAVLRDAKYVGQVIGRSGQHAVLAVRTQFMSEDDSAKVYFRLLEICDKHRAPGFELGLAGPPALGAALNALMMQDLKRTGVLAVLAMLIALVFLFRHPMGMVGPLGVVLQAGVWTFGAMAALGVPVTMLSNILPAFLFCVGIGDSVHLQSVYRDARRLGRNNHDAIVYAVSTTAVPVLFTTLTTMVGLLSFRFASVSAISDMGTAGAWGVGVALLHSLVFLPIVLSFNQRSLLGARGAGGADGLDRWLDRARRFSFDPEAPSGAPLGRGTPRRTRALVLACAIFVIGGALTTWLEVFHHPIMWIPEGSPVRTAFETLDAEAGGTANVQLLFEAKAGRSVKDLKLLRGMEQLEAHIRGYVNAQDGAKLVGNTLSLLDVIKETNQALHDDDPAFYKLPDTDRGVSDLLFMFENAGPEQLRQLATNDLRKTQMTIRVRWVDATSYGAFTEHIQAGIDRFIGDRAVVKPTGAIYSLFSVIANLIADLMRSFLVAFAAITVMMVLMLRDLKLGLIAMVPNLLPIVAIMGGMGLTGIPIDMSTLLIASIAIGIAVDDTIHFLHHFQAHYRLNGDVEAALSYTFRHSGRAMVSTSVILCGGFCVYMSAGMYNIGRFGALVAATVVLALLIDLLFAPALLRTFYKDRART